MTIHSFTEQDVSAVFSLEQKYAQAYPGVPVFPGEMYLSPGFHGGQDVFCASENGQLLAYAPVYVQLVDGPEHLPHVAWTEIKADPELADPNPVKDELLGCVLARARELLPPGNTRRLQVCFQYTPVEQPAIAYAEFRGFARTETVFGMQRDLSQPIPQLPTPTGITLRRWKMDTEPDQQMYVRARNECFPEAPVILGDWQYFLGSSMWAVGTSIAAFAGEELVGNVAVYWSADENEQMGIKAGATEYIFVRPGWRGQGIAPAMITEGMRYLKERGLEWAKLEVKALNANALGLYTRLGYEVVSESRFYAKDF